MMSNKTSSSAVVRILKQCIGYKDNTDRYYVSSDNSTDDTSQSDSDSSSENSSESSSVEQLRNMSMSKFSHSDYIGIDIIRRVDNNYINVSKLCNDLKKKFTQGDNSADSESQEPEIDNGSIESEYAGTNGRENQSFDVWLALDTTIELMDVLSSKTGIPVTELYGPYHEEQSEYNTDDIYAHPLLVPHYISWTSPLAALMVSDAVNRPFIYDHNHIDENENSLSSLESIDKKLSKVLKKNKKMGKKIKKLVIENTAIRHDVNFMSRQAEYEPDDILFIIINDVKYSSQDEEPYIYTAMTVTYNELYEKIGIHGAMFPDMEIVKIIRCYPGISLWKEIITRYQSKIDHRSNRFNLNGVSEEWFIRAVTKVHRRCIKNIQNC